VATLILEDQVVSDRSSAPGLAPELRSDPTSGCREALFSFVGRAGGMVTAPDGSLLVSDMTSGVIWRVDRSGAVLPLVPMFPQASDSSEQPLHLFNAAGLALAADGTLFIADSSRHRICALSSEGTLRVVAGGTNGYRDGPGADAMFRFPSDVAVAPDGTCFVADTVNDRIRAVAPDGNVTTVAGSIYDYGNGRGQRARFRRPSAIDLDEDGTLYVADTGNNTIRRITPDGEVSTIAGWPPGGDSDGYGAGVGLRWPTGIAVDIDGSLWVADHGNATVRHLGVDGESTTKLRLSGSRWPTVLSRGSRGAMTVAAEAWAVDRPPRSCVVVLGDPR
jgi:sugar lactone lactonase YvrE